MEKANFPRFYHSYFDGVPDSVNCLAGQTVVELRPNYSDPEQNCNHLLSCHWSAVRSPASDWSLYAAMTDVSVTECRGGSMVGPWLDCDQGRKIAQCSPGPQSSQSNCHQNSHQHSQCKVENISTTLLARWGDQKNFKH